MKIICLTSFFGVLSFPAIGLAQLNMADPNINDAAQRCMRSNGRTVEAQLQCMADLGIGQALTSNNHVKVGLVKSQLTDKNNISINISANNFGALYLKCIMGKTSLVLDRVPYRYFPDDLKYFYRCDDGGINSIVYDLDERGMLSTNAGFVVGFWQDKKAIRFITSMIGHQKLVFQVGLKTPETVTLEFDISGIDAAINELRKSCDW